MEYWVLCGIGFVFTIITRIVLFFITEFEDNIYDSSIFTKIVIHLLAAISVILVGGVFVGQWIGQLNISLVVGVGEWIGLILIGFIIPSVLTYVVGFFVLGLYHFKLLSNICFCIVFIIAVVGFGTAIYDYNKDIEVATETIITEKEEHSLLYFCNIPVQKISGEIKGSSVVGTGRVDGNISTSDELTYWYANEIGEGMYDSCLAANSKIVFIEEYSKPYVEIIDYCDQTIEKNHNNGREKTSTDNAWTQYVFYLPESIMQYKLE